MIINFDDYRTIPMIYAEDLNNIAKLHHTDHYSIGTYIPEFENRNALFLSEDTNIRNQDDYFRHLYNEQRQMEMSDEYKRYIKASWENNENRNEDKGE